MGSPSRALVAGGQPMAITDTGSYRIQVYQKEAIHLEPHQFAPPMRSVTLHQE